MVVYIDRQKKSRASRRFRVDERRIRSMPQSATGVILLEIYDRA